MIDCSRVMHPAKGIRTNMDSLHAPIVHFQNEHDLERTCVASGLASAVHFSGDTSAALTIAAIGKASLNQLASVNRVTFTSVNCHEQLQPQYGIIRIK